MSKTTKVYTVTYTRISSRSASTMLGTLVQLIEEYSYTLECGAAYAHETGNHTINQLPKTIKSLINNLNWSADNCTANGYAGTLYSYTEVTDPAELARYNQRDTFA